MADLDASFQIIKEIENTSYGIITTKQVEDVGLNRTILKSFVDEGLLLKESQGIY